MSALAFAPRRLLFTVALLSVGALTPLLLAQQPFPQPPVFPPAGTFGPPPAMPNINPPRFPVINPPVIPPVNPPTMPGFNPPGILEKVWVCERCGHELSRGVPAPIGTVCPGCGARINRIDGNPNPMGPMTMPGFNPPAGSVPPGGSMPPIGANPPIMPGNTPAPISPASSSPAVPSTSSGSSPSVTPSSLPTVIVGIVIIAAGLVVLGGAACLIIYNVARSSTPTRRRRRLVDYDD